MIQNKNIQIDDIQTKMSSTGNTKYTLLSGKEKFYFWKIHKGQSSPVYESYEGMEKAGLIKKGSVVAIGYTEEEDSFVNAQGKTVNFTSRCIVGLREAGSGAEPTQTAPQAKSPNTGQSVRSSEVSRDEFSRRLGIQGHLNALLSNPNVFGFDQRGLSTGGAIVKAIEIEDELEKRLNPSPVRQAVERTNPHFFKKEELPTIQVEDDPTGGELNPFVNDDEPPLEEPPF